MSRAFACVRTALVGPLFISLWTYFIPRWFGGPHAFEDARPAGWIMVATGALVVLPSMSIFAWRGFGTPAPFDPPRRLVISGPYRFVRNPMYVGFVVVLAGEAIVYPYLTRLMVGTLAVFVALATGFVMTFEEPVLRSKFGDEYAAYCRNVGRWIPRFAPWYSDRVK
jgi:protein-S-isoprenylcysteine O-methyltransferase Ste14